MTGSIQKPAIALIAAGQGDFRDALRAMLFCLPELRIIEVDDTVGALAALAEHHPKIVVINSALPGNYSMQLVQTIQSMRPRIPCAILVDHVWQQAAAIAAGADRATLKGEPAARLFTQFEQLLQPATG